MAVVIAVAVLAGGSTGAALLLHHHGGNAAGGRTGSSVPPRSATKSSTPNASSLGVGSPSAGTEQAQLTQLATQIQQSESARSTVITATQGVGGCTMTPSTGIGMMNQAISERQAIVGQLRTLSTTALPGGQQLQADFEQLLLQSVQADQDFIGWMQDIQSSATCPLNTSTDASYQAGLRASRQVDIVKNGFLKLWNPLASLIGQSALKAAQI